MKILIAFVLIFATGCGGGDRNLFDAQELAKEIKREERQLQVDRGNYMPANSGVTARTDTRLQEFNRRGDDLKAKREKLSRMITQFKLDEKEVWANAAPPKKKRAVINDTDSPEWKRAKELSNIADDLEEQMPGDPAAKQARRQAMEAKIKAVESQPMDKRRAKSEIIQRLAAINDLRDDMAAERAQIQISIDTFNENVKQEKPDAERLAMWKEEHEQRIKETKEMLVQQEARTKMRIERLESEIKKIRNDAAIADEEYASIKREVGL